MIHEAPEPPSPGRPPDPDDSSGKGVGPVDSVELGRAKYWNGGDETSVAEEGEEKTDSKASRPSYFREAMTGIPEPAEPFDPVPRP